MENSNEISFPLRVSVNDLDLFLAIREGMGPMQEWFDTEHDSLPFFWNYITGPHYGNSHHRSYSAVHAMGRWLDALVNAQEITKEPVSEEVYQHLEYWAYRIFENGTGMMANLNLDTFTFDNVCDLHNLREAMYAFAALVKRNPNDPRPKKAAAHLIDMVDRYTDFETGEWKSKLYKEERNGKVECGASSSREVYRFSSTLGRYIGGLVRLYLTWPYQKALDQAIRLTDTALRVVLLPDGEFDTDRFAEHLHSTSSMISGIAMLGSLIGDMEILERVKAFMENGYYDMALDFGWCLENMKRPDDLVGEINNTGDYLEACLCLGNAGYSTYYDRADKMIHAHLLPAQLLDVSFIPDKASPDCSINHMASRMRGAFGFPCPYGHEYEPGSEISFNWDIVGGGVSSLCWAARHIVTKINGIASINLQFDVDHALLSYQSPYQHQGILSLEMKEDLPVRILFPQGTDWIGLEEALLEAGPKYTRKGNWIYLYGLYEYGILKIPVIFQRKTVHYCFREHEFDAVFSGNRIQSMKVPGNKRLLFFAPDDD